MTIEQVWGLGFLAMAVGMLTAGIVADIRLWRRQQRRAALDAANDAARRAGEILNGSHTTTKTGDTMKKRHFESTLQRAEKAERKARELGQALGTTIKEKYDLRSLLIAARKERDDSVFEVESLMDQVENLTAVNAGLWRNARRWQLAFAGAAAFILLALLASALR